MSRRGAAVKFGVSESAAINWVKRMEQTGSRAQPSLAATSRDVGAALGASRTPVMSRFLRHLGVTLKKRLSRAA
jgi:transposase